MCHHNACGLSQDPTIKPLFNDNKRGGEGGGGIDEYVTADYECQNSLQRLHIQY